MITKIAIHGAAGRMGRRLVALATENEQLEVAAAVEDAGSPLLGQDAGELAGVGTIGVPLTSELAGEPAVVIDFSVPAAAVKIAQACAQQRVALVSATTGLEAAQQEVILAAAQQVPLLQAPNTSLAVNLVMNLSRTTAAALAEHPSGADVEIIERHHRFKEDAPSGTALKFGEIIAGEMKQAVQRHGREGRPGARPHDEIGYHAVRTGDNPGEHTIVFGLLGETIELRVAATSRDAYAHGALAAAEFLVGKPAGLYHMNDLLGLS
ncbi:MAG: 4-hydroxy-tetrahydrodipicolinate reductase [Planctomycetota bacterium]|nr:MAG: 4-hydroxy-tetrahydrodipicolinate reductase [Planctomycetota bacterium]